MLPDTMFPETIDVKVEQEHIDAGRQSDCHNCPIALAVAKAVSGFTVSVGVTLRLHKDGAMAEYSLPREAMQFMVGFDFRGRKGAQPIEFQAVRRTGE